MSKTYFLTKTIRIDGHVCKVEELGYGDAERTRKEAARVINQLAGYDIREKGNRIIATLHTGEQAIKVFIEARDTEAGKKFNVKKSIHKNSVKVGDLEVVFSGSREECAAFVKAELERYNTLNVTDSFTTEAGSGHVEYTTKKGSQFKVNYLVKAA